MGYSASHVILVADRVHWLWCSWEQKRRWTGTRHRHSFYFPSFFFFFVTRSLASKQGKVTEGHLYSRPLWFFLLVLPSSSSFYYEPLRSLPAFAVFSGGPFGNFLLLLLQICCIIIYNLSLSLFVQLRSCRVFFSASNLSSFVAYISNTTHFPTASKSSCDRSPWRVGVAQQQNRRNEKNGT